MGFGLFWNSRKALENLDSKRSNAPICEFCGKEKKLNDFLYVDLGEIEYHCLTRGCPSRNRGSIKFALELYLFFLVLAFGAIVMRLSMGG